jgi:hypothetical protein
MSSKPAIFPSASRVRANPLADGPLVEQIGRPNHKPATGDRRPNVAEQRPDTRSRGGYGVVHNQLLFDFHEDATLLRG